MDSSFKEADLTGVLAASRRGFLALGAVAALPAAALAANEVEQPAIRHLDVHVPGWQESVSAEIYRPDQGSHPGLVIWAAPSAGTRSVARRLAGQGWSVLLVPVSFGRDDAMHREARSIVAWLVGQEGVSPSGPIERDRHGLGHGYSLRTITAAYPRMSLAGREERMSAAASAWLIAAPDAAIREHPARVEQLAAAVRSAHRAGALAA